MSDLVERLRIYADRAEGLKEALDLRDAASELVTLRTAFRREREINRHLREALLSVRSKGICAGAAFVRCNEDGSDRCLEVLDIIDGALSFEPRPASEG